MNRKLSSLILAAILVLMFVGIYWSSLDACTFTAFVRDPSQNLNTIEYGRFVSYLPITAQANGANDGFSVSWYPTVPPLAPGLQCSRWPGGTGGYNPYTWPGSEYYSDSTEVAATRDYSTVVICHARNSNNHPGWENPHPFVYDNSDPYQHGILGKSYAFMHNGNLYLDDLLPQVGLRNKVNVAFSALDLCQRYYAGWREPSEVVDSELLGELIMKYLLMQYNYYWWSANGPSYEPPWTGASLEEWAIHRAAQGFPHRQEDWDPDDNNSINGVLTDGSQVWALARSDNIDPHTVSYKDAYASYYCREVVSKNVPTGFISLVAEGYGNVVRLSGQAGDTPTPHSMEDDLVDPTELRINSRGHSAGDQKQPAISVSPSDGSWVVVWGVSDNLIGRPAIAHSANSQTITVVWTQKTYPLWEYVHPVVVGRWYNQMGMAETDQFTISTNFDAQLDGGAEILRRTYDWVQATHSWHPRTEGVITVDTHDSETGLSNPTVAYSESGDYAIAWEREGGEHREIHVKGFNPDGSVQFNEQTIPAQEDAYEPDIAFVENIDGLGDVFAISFHEIISAVGYSKAVLLHSQPVSPNTYFGPVANLSQGGFHASVAPLSDSEFFVAYNFDNTANHQIKVNYCYTTNWNDINHSADPATGEPVPYDSRPDIATRRSTTAPETYYVCYEVTDGGNGYEIHCARGVGTGTTLVIEDNVNQFSDGDQKLPVIAIAPSYPINPIGTEGFYTHYTNSGIFEVRRMIVWQTLGQDTTTEDWGIAGQFRGILGDNLYAWYTDDSFNPNVTPTYLPSVVDESMTVSNPMVYMISNVDVMPGATLTFASGVTVYAAPGCSLRVAGGLVVEPGCQFTMLEPPNRWGGIYVTGNATLTGCTIDGATTGITTKAATQLIVDNCAIQGNGVGIYIYAPSGAGIPEISHCTITSNEAEGVSLFSTYKTDIHDCPNISSNGTHGILLNDSKATISHNHFTGNTKYGVYCYGSSPTLFCNEFIEDQTGEMFLIKNSHPVLWKDNGVDGGANTFVSTNRTLITMEDSYPIVAGGLNSFTIFGTVGYYMADISVKVPKHDVTKNEWSQDPPPDSTFFPEDYAFWFWAPTEDLGNCGDTKGSSSNAAQILFEQGYTAEMAGNTAAASTNYLATIAQYPDSSWAQVAAVRLFENQRQIGSAYSDLGAYYATIETNYAEDTSLVETVQDMATRTLVEDAQYDPALSIYEEIMTHPPSVVDSAYAALDYVITVMREQYDSPYGGLDGPLSMVSTQTIHNLLEALHQVIPPVPEANHQNYLRPPENYVLEQNYPNPFNATTTLHYAIPSSGRVKLTIYNIMGQKVATLVDGHQEVGYHSIIWNSTNLASGVYIYQLQAGSHTLAKKMVLLK